MESTLTAEGALESLRTVYDPEIGINIVDLGLVYGVEINEDKAVDVTMTLTSMGCPLGPVIIQDIQRSLASYNQEISDVRVKIVWSPPWSPDMMTEDAKDELGIW